MKRLDQKHLQPYLESTQEILDRFSIVGLRTLVFAMRHFTKEEFELTLLAYKEAMLHSHKTLMIQDLADNLEQNLILLGCTAIEDQLQDQVPESIKKFQEANIKVWMLTGDKLETAVNIAMTAGIAQIDSKIVRFTGGCIEDFPKYVETLKRELDAADSSLKKTIVIDTHRNCTLIMTKDTFSSHPFCVLLSLLNL